MNIRDQIVQKRRARIRTHGHTFGHPVPQVRVEPVNPFVVHPLLICEIKRRSPSKGNIDANLEPVEQAGLYLTQGCKSVSILTEEDYFGGSLLDLMNVKKAHPSLSVLRKDFLIDRDDVLVSHRAGADAILLIASMLEGSQLAAMHALAVSLGMSVLVELHDEADLEKVRFLAPSLVGINCRDLKTFKLDRLAPLALKNKITWPCEVVFESGIFSATDARFAASHGFTGLLVGEAVVKKPSLVGELHTALASSSGAHGGSRVPPSRTKSLNDFWQRLAEKLALTPTKPLVKICGLARIEDAIAASRAGADILGFVFAESPRRATEALVRDFVTRTGANPAVTSSDPLQSPSSALRVAVVVGSIPPDCQRLLDDGLIDAVQWSGDEDPTALENLSFPWYKALRPQNPADLANQARWRSPRLLLDAGAPGVYGGSGKRVPEGVVEALELPLWLAGGLNPENIADTYCKYKPELVDVSSGLESEPGKKDLDKINNFFKELERGRSKE